ncbi:MAG: Cof-type HAD-IIB family hydrolase [Oscillospiraceae bacterium]
MLAVDLDGTLLDDNNELSRGTVKAITAAREAGVYILPVSGRPYRSIAPVMDELRFSDNYAVAMAGSDIRKYPDGKSLHSVCLTARDMLKIYEFSLKLGITLQIFRVDGSYFFSEDNDYTAAYARYFGYEGKVADLTALPFDDVCKCMLLLEEERMGEVISSARSLLSPELRVEPTWATIIDLYAAGGDKATALRYVAKKLGIPMCEVAAVGDEIVDIPMLDAAGLGIAMGNANEELKARGYAVVSDNAHDGVARAIYDLILKS